MIFSSEKILTMISILLLLGGSLSAQDIRDSAESNIRLTLRSKEGLDTARFNIFPKKYNKKKIGLVLSGGGARGLAQIGVLEELEASGIEPDLIVGTSIGSVIGGLYATGYNASEMKKTLKAVEWGSILSLTNKYLREALFVEQKNIQDKSLLTISLEGLVPTLPSSLSNGQQIAEVLNVLFLNAKYKPVKSFRDLKYPFFAVATDLDNGEKVILSKGNISQSVKASLTFPLLFSPTIIGNRNLVDGGLAANIPVSIANDLGADLVIAVNSTSPLRTADELKNPLNTADQILSITMAQLNKQQLAFADIVITPEVGSRAITDFSNIDFLIDKGKTATSLMIKSIKEKIDSAEISSSEYYNNFIINPLVLINNDLIPSGLRNDVIFSQKNKFVKFTAIEKTLKDFYNTGYFRDVYATVKRKDDVPYIIYNFKEYPVLNNITVNKSYPYQDSLVKSFLDGNRGEHLNSKTAYKLYESILANFRERGLSAIDINKFYIDEASGELKIEFSDGKLNQIKIKGNDITKENLIFRELNIFRDSVIHKNDLALSLSNIFSTNLFKQLSLNLQYNKSDSKPELVIDLVEKSSKNIRFSMRADNERNLQVFLDLRNENLLGTGNEIGLSALGGLRNREYKFELKSNRFFNSLFTYNLSVYYRFRNINIYKQVFDNDNNSYTRDRNGEYRDIKYGGSFLLGKQLEKSGLVYAQLSFETMGIDLIQANIGEQSDLNVFKLKVGGTIDTQNKFPFPTEGTFMNYFYEATQQRFVGNLSYSKLLIDFEQYIPAGSRRNIRTKLKFGFAEKTTPLVDYFSFGGENSFYGMVEDELRGRQILSASVEYRYFLPYKLFFDTYLLFRYDLGRIWENSSDIRFKDLRHGFGISAAFDTPVGKASFSAGKTLIINKGLTKDSFIWGPNTFYFSIGYDF